MPVDWMVLLVLGAWLVSSWVRIAREDQRYALLRLGKFTGLKGPGIVLVYAPIDRAVPLSVGDEGERISAEAGVFQGVHVPIWPDDPIPIGGRMRIVGFPEGSAVRVAEAHPPSGGEEASTESGRDEGDENGQTKAEGD